LYNLELQLGSSPVTSLGVVSYIVSILYKYLPNLVVSTEANPVWNWSVLTNLLGVAKLDGQGFYGVSGSRYDVLLAPMLLFFYRFHTVE
jgi:hypothetical protein